jgi:two-component system, cell cycle response regulator
MHDAWAWNRYLSRTGPEKARNAHAMPMPPPHDQASPKILIADDDSTMRTMLLSGLTRLGYQVVVANNGDQAWELLQRPDAPEIAILDWLMPGVTGIELCRRLRERKALPYTYVILLTGMDTLDDLVTGLESGADDYITKPFKVAVLNARLRAGRRILDLQRELLAAQAQLTVLANRDSLTKLWNRRVILELLNRELARALREHSSLGLILLDIDHFKRVNDSFGHSDGDGVLRQVAKRLHTSIRPYDNIGRYGGEEFLIVTPNCDVAQTIKIAERVRHALCSAPIRISSGAIPVTASLGVCTATGDQRIDANTLILAADRALYRAKDLGRNRVEWCSPEPSDGTPGQ